MGSLRKGLFLLILPAVEYAVLRLWLRYGLELRFGFANTTDFDFLVPAPIAFLLFVYVLEKKAPLEISISPLRLIFNFICLMFFIGASLFFNDLAIISATMATAIWALTLLGVGVSSLMAFINPRQVFKNENWLAVLPCLMIGSSLYFYQNGFRWLWLGLGDATAYVLHEIFRAVPLLGGTAYYTAEEAVRVDLANFSVRMARGCGGGDGFFYFGLSYLLYSLVVPGRIKWGQWAASFAIGLIFMFALNVVRILGLIYFGRFLVWGMGYENGVALFKSLFHIHSGWLLYSAGIFVFLRFSSQLFVERQLPGTNPEDVLILESNVEAAQSVHFRRFR